MRCTNGEILPQFRTIPTSTQPQVIEPFEGSACSVLFDEASEMGIDSNVAGCNVGICQSRDGYKFVTDGDRAVAVLNCSQDGNEARYESAL